MKTVFLGRRQFMAIHTISDLPLLGQDKTNGCWYFSAKMIAGWAAKTGKATIKDPATLTDLFNLYDGNCGYALSTCGTLATKLGMKALPRQERGFSDMMTLLSKGPLWVAGLKTIGAETFPHVVVIGGVADTGVLVLDPLPLKQGNRDWKTWSWLKNFLALSDGAFDANLLTPA
jgi:hypothetical protein